MSIGYRRRILAALFAGVMLTNPAVAVYSSENEVSGLDALSAEVSGEGVYGLSYPKAEQQYAENGYQNASDETIILDLKKAAASRGAAQFRQGMGGSDREALFWDKDVERYEFPFEIEKSGLYTLEIDYFLPEGSGTYAERGFLIDGALPFQEAGSVRFYRYYRDAVATPRRNSLGDEVHPRQEEITGWYTMQFLDSRGMSVRPMRLYLEAGSHTLGLDYLTGDAALGEIRMISPEQPEPYEQYLLRHAQSQNSAAVPEFFEAETSVVSKTSLSLRRVNSGDPIVTPRSDRTLLLNAVGGYNWRGGNEAITWEFNVKDSGFYMLSAQNSQVWGDGLPSHREIRIDGEVPFAEIESYAFEYGRNWNKRTLSDKQGEPYCFYLKAGRHTLTLTVKMGASAKVIETLTDCSRVMSGVIRKITMITGPAPDLNYEYELETDVPDLLDDMDAVISALDSCIEWLDELSGESSLVNSYLKSIRTQLKMLYRKPDRIPANMGTLHNALSSFGNLIITLQDQPLTIDSFTLTPKGQTIETPRSSFSQRMIVTLKNFFYSFFKDYKTVGSVLDEDTVVTDTIDVWIARGKEYGELIKELADETFTPGNGIEVRLNIMPPGTAAGAINPLMLAVNSGRAPDVSMGQLAGQPAELAFRGAVLDLTQFEDFETVSKRFLPEILVPLGVNGGIYGLPELMGFRTLFYRTDIFSELGLSVPDTWDELYRNVLPALNQNGMQFYYAPQYDPFLFQYGGTYYDKNGLVSALDTPQAFQSFKELCELYTAYGVPVSASFFNRFRTGEIPAGVGDFSFYTQLAAAAPELNGLWTMSLLPGHATEDGINRTVGPVSADAAVILSGSKNKEAAWQYIKWWTSSQTQSDFAMRIEASLGIAARWPSANLEAFLSLPWRPFEKRVITEQMEWVRETPVYLGGYFSGRHFTNAFTKVVVSNLNVRDALEKAVEDINKEMLRKREQFGIDD